MFWRILGRELKASRARLLLALLVVVSGAAVVSALVNLQLDIDGKLARTFRVFGANVLVAPPAGGTHLTVMPVSVWDAVAARRDARIVAAAPYLYVVAKLPQASSDVLLAGTDLARVRTMNSWWQVDGRWPAAPDAALVGSAVAGKLKISPGDRFQVASAGRKQTLVASGVVTAGGPEDDQVLTSLQQAQQLGGLAGRISLVQVSVAGTAAGIRQVMSELTAAVPGAEVRPIPQYTAAEAQLAGKIGLLVEVTVGLILLLTVLGVLASMAALATERRRDVGVMKAIGGDVPRIIRLFLAEVGLVAVGGALAGCALGFPLSSWISERAFGSGVAMRWEVLPLVAALMFGAALAGALPLRLLGRVRPALILRGEGWSL